MEFYQPQLTLTYTVPETGPVSFHLNARVKCPTSNYHIVGYELHMDNLDVDKLVEVNLLVDADASQTAEPVYVILEYNIDLGPFSDENRAFTLDASVYDGPIAESNPPKGKTTVSSTTASEKERPFIPYNAEKNE